MRAYIVCVCVRACVCACVCIYFLNFGAFLHPLMIVLPASCRVSLFACGASSCVADTAVWLGCKCRSSDRRWLSSTESSVSVLGVRCCWRCFLSLVWRNVVSLTIRQRMSMVSWSTRIQISFLSIIGEIDHQETIFLFGVCSGFHYHGNICFLKKGWKLQLTCRSVGTCQQLLIALTNQICVPSLWCMNQTYLSPLRCRIWAWLAIYR